MLQARFEMDEATSIDRWTSDGRSHLLLPAAFRLFSARNINLTTCVTWRNFHHDLAAPPKLFDHGGSLGQ